MANVLQQIRTDHVNMARLLNLVEAEIAKARQDGMPDFLMLEHVLRYATNYLDQMHHAREDAMFRRVVMLEPEAKTLVEEIELEHEQLKSTGEQLYNLVCAAQNADFVRREDVILKGTDYVDTLRAHMQKEESDLLVRASRLLTESDLDEVDAEVEAIHDPLFGGVVEQEYQGLYNYIMAQQESIAEVKGD